MPVIKIEEAGYEQFTGNIAGFQFVNGVTVEPLSKQEADRFAAIMRVSCLDSGIPQEIGAASRIINRDVELPTVSNQMLEKQDEPEPVVEVISKSRYTEAQLEAIADEKGIEGLREIGRLYGIKGRAIHELIEEIIKAQG